MPNYRVNYILDIMVQTIRYKRMLKFKTGKQVHRTINNSSQAVSGTAGGMSQG